MRSLRKGFPRFRFYNKFYFPLWCVRTSIRDIFQKHARPNDKTFIVCGCFSLHAWHHRRNLIRREINLANVYRNTFQRILEYPL